MEYIIKDESTFLDFLTTTNDEIGKLVNSITLTSNITISRDCKILLDQNTLSGNITIYKCNFSIDDGYIKDSNISVSGTVACSAELSLSNVHVVSTSININKNTKCILNSVEVSTDAEHMIIVDGKNSTCDIANNSKFISLDGNPGILVNNGNTTLYNDIIIISNTINDIDAYINIGSEFGSVNRSPEFNLIIEMPNDEIKPQDDEIKQQNDEVNISSNVYIFKSQVPVYRNPNLKSHWSNIVGAVKILKYGDVFNTISFTQHNNKVKLVGYVPTKYFKI